MCIINMYVVVMMRGKTTKIKWQSLRHNYLGLIQTQITQTLKNSLQHLL